MKRYKRVTTPAMNSANTNITLPSIKSLLNSIDSGVSGASGASGAIVPVQSAATVQSASNIPIQSTATVQSTANAPGVSSMPVLAPRLTHNYTSAPVQPIVQEQVAAPTPALASLAGPGPGSGMKKSFERRQSRSNLPKETIQILNSWLLNHLNNPYPTAQEKRELLIKTGLTKIQLSNWFINVRRRKIFSDYYNLAKRSAIENGTDSARARSHSESGPTNASATVQSPYHREGGREPASAEIPLTRRKKLIDRLRELKKLANEEAS